MRKENERYAKKENNLKLPSAKESWTLEMSCDSVLFVQTAAEFKQMREI